MWQYFLSGAAANLSAGEPTHAASPSGRSSAAHALAGGNGAANGRRGRGGRGADDLFVPSTGTGRRTPRKPASEVVRCFGGR